MKVMRMILVALVSMAAVGTAFALAGSRAQEEPGTWVVPEEERAVPNPVERTPEALAAGAELFKKHCVMCHGEAGKGDGPATKFMQPAPHDITTPAVRDRLTDGEIFYKISVGKRPMPPMNRKLSETERWQVVHHVRVLQEQ